MGAPGAAKRLNGQKRIGARPHQTIPRYAFQRFGRIKVAQHRVIGHFNLHAAIGIFAGQMPRADIAGNRQHLGQEFARPKHGIPLLAAESRHHNRAAFFRIKRRHQPIKHRRTYQRHIAQAHHEAFNILGQSLQPCLERG
jgi:hypothetical protein